MSKNTILLNKSKKIVTKIYSKDEVCTILD